MTTTTTVPAQKRILIVDDEPDMTFLVRLNLQKTGRFEVQEENRATQAIDVVRFQAGPDSARRHDAGTRWWRRLALLKDDADLRNIPVVFLTATVLKEEVSSNQGRIGGYPFISKPFEVDTLVAHRHAPVGTVWFL